ncbi:MAG: N-acetylmuramic acid 6-phosphate etherase [Vicingaceae bacterium]|jgi:N-acetylmuramic acid 6-phosphate etherase|nr:MAG: N-acetylmuramic acid 6-phosphate etherase [Vicingaceae bacterium]
MVKKITEQDSLYDNLENMPVIEILENINKEDQKVAICVAEAIPAIEKLIQAAYQKMFQGGRLFYIGAGTSGRLGVLDAAECPPTYGVDYNTVIGIIAGGDQALRRAVENAEDDTMQGWIDLQAYNINTKDFVIGLSASGTTPYVTGTLEQCRKNNITTGCITCNLETPLARLADYPVEVIVGPEFVTGSTRMKAGTAQKLVLNMISTTLMIKLGHVKGNKMIDMKISNTKLKNRGIGIIMRELNVDEKEAQKLLEKYGSVRKVLINKK